MKRGFKLQREAKDWERNFLEKQSGSPHMTFQALYDLYLEDIRSRLKPTTQRRVNCQLNAILNFAVKYYGLLRNPCTVVGSIGNCKAEKMDFWTLEEFKKFIACVDNPMYNALFNILSGILTYPY